MLFSVFYLLGIQNIAMAETRPLDETILEAQTALLSENYDQVFVILEGAERAFERSYTIVKAQDLATVFYYRGVAAQLNQSDGIPHFRSALSAYPSLEWDNELSADELSQDIFAQVKREISGRSKVDPYIPEKVGLAKVYINGVQRNSGEKVISGIHLAQIKCPKGDVYGKWTDFSKPVKWLKMCPYKVDVDAVPVPVENEWASLMPSGIPSIGSIPSISGVTTPAASKEDEDVVVLSAWQKINKPYLAVAAGLATLSGLSYSAASTANSEYYDIDNPEINSMDDLNALQSRTNRYMSASIGLGIGAAAMYTAAFWRVRK